MLSELSMPYIRVDQRVMLVMILSANSLVVAIKAGSAMWVRLHKSNYALYTQILQM